MPRPFWRPSVPPLPAQQPPLVGRRASYLLQAGWRRWLAAFCVLYSLVSSFFFFKAVLPTSALDTGTSRVWPSSKEMAAIPRRRLFEQPFALSADTDIQRERHITETVPKTLSFAVCNGFANQRLALLNGMILGKELNRAVVLPSFIANGRQDDPSATNYGGDSDVPMSMFYNVSHFVDVMESLGVRIVKYSSRSSIKAVPENSTEAAMHQPHQEHHLLFGCPLLRLGPKVILRNEAFVIATLSALLPNDTLSLSVATALHNLRSMSRTGLFNVLHLRLESDWMTHCSSWRFGLDSDNCFTNTLNIEEHIKLKGMESDSPLYVSLDRDAVSKPVLAHVLNRLRSGGYQVVERHDILPWGQWPREIAALVEYYIALNAHKFIGNSVSTFSALAILERERRGTWASYYNMGDIPLSAFMPLYQMPWVFTYNGASPRVNYMIKAAVISARMARLTPFCIYNGTNKDPMYSWLHDNGVRMVLHVPQWLPQIRHVFPIATKNSGWSPLYKSFEALFGTFQRIDVPIVWELEQYNYVLFADADVVFERPITLQSFEQPLPKSLAMAFEMEDIFPCNAGVALMNLPYLRDSYKKFIQFVFSNPSLYYEGYGPGDQGALNQFYADSMGRKCSLSEAFNAKPHKNGNVKDPFLIHFHGPKPMDYLRWRQTGSCDFGQLCAKGFDAACKTMQKYEPYLPTCRLPSSS